MKKLFVYFVLISSLFYGIGGASSNPKKQVTDGNRAWALQVGPYKAISMMFEDEHGLKNHDLRTKDEVMTAPHIISQMYPNRPELQKQAIDTLGQCMRNQTVNGRKKYNDRDVQIMVTYSKRALGLN